LFEDEWWSGLRRVVNALLVEYGVSAVLVVRRTRRKCEPLRAHAASRPARSCERCSSARIGTPVLVRT
jgi:hypothetical protein